MKNFFKRITKNLYKNIDSYIGIFLVFTIIIYMYMFYKIELRNDILNNACSNIQNNLHIVLSEEYNTNYIVIDDICYIKVEYAKDNIKWFDAEDAKKIIQLNLPKK